MAEITSIAEYAMDELKKAGAQKAACTVSQSKTDELNIEAGKFSLMRTLFSDNLHMKALVDGKKGTISVNKLDKASINEAVADTIALAKSGTADAAEDIAPLAENKQFDQTIGGANMDKLFSRTKDFVDQTTDEFPKIILGECSSQFSNTNFVHVNSNGVNFSNSLEYYHMSSMFSAKDGTESTSFYGYGTIMNSLNTPFIDVGLQRTLLEEAVNSIKTRMVEGKFVGKVIVTPTCADMLWGTVMGCFLSEYSLISGTSRWKDSLGEKVADKQLTFSAIAHNPDIVLGEKITGDGFESQNFDFIKDGILQSYGLSLYGANKTGKPRSLNSSGSWAIAPGETSLADMIKSVDKGIIIGRFSGASPGPSGDVSGVAKNSFLIENGKVTDALGETMISFNVFDVIQEIVAISKERVVDGYSLMPWCCVDGVTVSGK
ncbi:MAG: TldD/PmbA family protein [Firmicutes bacterium]|nr:TldD/PmbA family protein [Bacillota bacterium]